MTGRLWGAALCVTLATVAIAHTGVTNPTVKARMDAMGEIGKATKVLGQMVKGEAGFDVDAAQLAAHTIARVGTGVPALFEQPEHDPKSEALPTIWEDFPDFKAKSREMTRVATRATVNIKDPASLKTALRRIGRTCKSCHASYRE